MALTQVTEKGIKDGEIVNADVNASAAIAKSKLAGLDIVNADVNASAAIAGSKLAASTTSVAGSMSAADKTKLDGVAASANNYTHPTSNGNKHIPADGSAGQFLKYDSAGTAVWAADNDTVYTHPNHSGEVTSTADGATVIASDIVDEDNLKVDNSPTNDYVLTAKSSAAGGLTWAAAAGGITEYDRWRITSTFTGEAEPVTDNWERNDNAGFEKIGTGMSESSGVFTFPSTGKWLLTFYAYGWHNAETRWTSTQIDTTTDTGSNWLRQSNAYAATPGDPNSSHFSSNCDFLFDVTNVSTHKCRFTIKVGSSINATTAASTNTDNTFATFMKLGDT